MPSEQLAIRALLGHAVDYAGMFPPARLPLDRAVRNYARYRGEPESWMLGRFICPAGRLSDLAPYAPELFGEGQVVPLSVLATAPGSSDAVTETLAEDLAALRAFDVAAAGRMTPDALELRVPDDVDGEDGFRDLFVRVTGTLDSGSPVPLPVFFEVGGGIDPRDRLEAAACALAFANLERRERAGAARFRPAGLKLRCGGLSARDFPKVELVARALIACREAKVPFKATAGLHHPLRHRRADLGVKAHGFVNLFGAAALAQARLLGEEVAAQILAEEDPAAFRFDDGAMRWRDFQATVDDIARARRLFGSFGSCSFDEPRDDLRDLGWLR